MANALQSESYVSWINFDTLQNVGKITFQTIYVSLKEEQESIRMKFYNIQGDYEVTT